MKRWMLDVGCWMLVGAKEEKSHASVGMKKNE